MKRLPRITVITPSYNQGKFIRETIESVLDQKYPFLEYIIVDGGSTDDTLKILKSYGKSIKWVSEKDHGQTDAINKGMKMSSGEIVCYLNSDDVFLPGTLLKVGETFAKHPTAEWLTGDYQIINEKGHIIQSFIVKYKTFFRNLQRSSVLYVLNYICQPSTFWKRSLFKKVGYFDTSLRYCMDYDFWLRLVKLEKPTLVPIPLSQFRIHSQSKGGSQFQRQFVEERLVQQRYNHSVLVTMLHNLHSSVTVLAYKVLKPA